MMERIKVESNIYVRVNKGRTYTKCFELSKHKTYKSLEKASKVFKEISKIIDNTYLYQTKNGFMVDVKMYYADLNIARASKECIIEIMDGVE